jgi:hypothetical protein
MTENHLHISAAPKRVVENVEHLKELQALRDKLGYSVFFSGFNIPL